VKAQRGALRGGKRPNNNPSASSNPAAGAKNRDEALTMIEMVGTSMLRFQAHPNASPAVNAVVQRMTQIVNIARQKQIDMNQLLFQISNESIKKLQTTTTSTKVEARCLAISNVLFGDLVQLLSELKRQYDHSVAIMPLVTQYLMTAKYGDDAGAIGWTTFIKG